MKNVTYISRTESYDMCDGWIEANTTDHFWIQWRYQQLLRILPQLVDLNPALDIGCSSGITISQLENTFDCAIDGCDVDRKGLERIGSTKGHIYYYDICEKNIQFKEKYSTIFLLDVLEHIPDPNAFLKAVHFHNSKNGLLIINVPAFQCLYGKYDEVQGHVKRYRTQELRNELEQAGYKVKKYFYWGMSLFAVALLRKIYLKFYKGSNVYSVGFQAQNSLVDSLLRTLKNIECAIPCDPLFGTSLMVLAEKCGDHQADTA